MISAPVRVLLVVGGLSAAGAALLLLHLENRRLDHQISTRRAEMHRRAELQRDNAALQAIVDASSGSAKDQVQRQVAAAREEVATLEHQSGELASRKALQDARDQDDLANNRDPRNGLTRLEYFQPAGRLTPTAAVETAIWAATKGDEAALMESAMLLPAARARADDLLAKLPDVARAQWTPEKLASLWMSSVVNDVTALQITGETYEDSQHAVVTFRIANRDQPEHVNLRLTKSGWKILLSENVIDQLSRRLNSVAVTTNVPPPTKP